MLFVYVQQKIVYDLRFFVEPQRMRNSRIQTLGFVNVRSRVYIRAILHVDVMNNSIGKSYTRMVVKIHVYVYFVNTVFVHVHLITYTNTIFRICVFPCLYTLKIARIRYE